MSNGAVIFRMVSSFYEDMQQCENQADAHWVVTASLKRSRGGRIVSATLTAENIITYELLTYPEDSEKISCVMPEEFWPQFIKDLPGAVPEGQPLLV